MGYGIGSMIAPQLVAPFLNPRLSAGAIPTAYQSTCREDNSSHNIISSTTSSVSTSATHDQSSPTYPAKFVTAYWIISGLSMSLACLFVGYHIHSRVTSISIDGNSQIRKGQQDKKNFKESISLKTCSATHPRYAGLIIVCLFAYYVVSVPLFRTFSKFIFSYARDGPCLTIQAATTLESAYFAAVTVGRLCAFLCSYVIHMKYILQVWEICHVIPPLSEFNSGNTVCSCNLQELSARVNETFLVEQIILLSILSAATWELSLRLAYILSHHLAFLRPMLSDETIKKKHWNILVLIHTGWSYWCANHSHNSILLSYKRHNIVDILFRPWVLHWTN